MIHYHSSWQVKNAEAWLTRHNIDADTYQRDFDNLPNQGYRPICVGAAANSEEERFSSIWSKAAGPRWAARHGIPESQYQSVFDEMMQQGLKPKCVSAYDSGNSVRFIVLFEESQVGWSARHGLDANQYQAEFDLQASQGMRPTWISVYNSQSGVRYAAIWEATSGEAWNAMHNANLADFTATSDKMHREGFQLICSTACATYGPDVYAGIWVKSAAAQLEQRHSLTPTEHQNIFDKLSRLGFAPTFVAASNVRENFKPARRAVLAYHNQFAGTTNNISNKLQQNQYEVHTFDEGSKAVEKIGSLAPTYRAGDRLFIYLGCHGGNARGSLKDTGTTPCGGHYLQTNIGGFNLSEVSGFFAQAANLGANVTVFDGSCNGGETVVGAMNENYGALSTCGVMAPALTGFPDPSIEFTVDDPQIFGRWWNPSGNLASQVNRQFKLSAPGRFHQRVLRNDNCEIGRNAPFWNTALDFLRHGDTWELLTWRCWIYRFMFKNEFEALDAATQALYTVSVDTFVKNARNIHADAEAALNSLSGFLKNPELRNQSKVIYGQHYLSAWDMHCYPAGLWNITFNAAHFDYVRKYQVAPWSYAGADGFIRLCDDLISTLAEIKTVIDELFEKYQTLSSKAQEMGLLGSTSLKGSMTLPKRFETPNDLDVYNTHFEKMLKLNSKYLSKVNWARVVQPLATSGGEQIALYDLGKINRVSIKIPNATRAKKSNGPVLDRIVEDCIATMTKRSLLLTRAGTLLSVIEDVWLAAESNKSQFVGDITLV